MSCSERSDEQAAERRRVRKERVEREREKVCWGPLSPATGRLPDCCKHI